MGCRASRPQITQSDSVKIEYRERIVEVPKFDTVTIDIPIQVAAAVVEDSSHLETDYAVSDAHLTPLGYLSHTLENKPVSVSEVIKYQDRIIYRDSIVYKDKSKVETKIVEKSFNKVQWFLFLSGILLWLIVLIFIWLRFKGIKL